jgi:hypothetical protein
MNISTNGKLLAAATKDIWLKWEETKEQWQDSKSQEFQHRYIEELIVAVDRAVPVFDDLDKLVSKVRNDCE